MIIYLKRAILFLKNFKRTLSEIAKVIEGVELACLSKRHRNKLQKKYKKFKMK